MTDNTKPDQELTQDFYKKTLRPDRQQSYKMTVKYIKKHIAPKAKSVVDYGCGAAWFLYYFNKMGITDLVGIEPNKDALPIMDISVADKVRFRSLTRSISLRRKFDVAMCIEVIEHIDKKYADLVIKNIIKHTDTLVFSAATPGQGGWGHINERPFEHWEKKLNKQGFFCDHSATDKFRSFLTKKGAKKWYCNNISIFRKNAK